MNNSIQNRSLQLPKLKQFEISNFLELENLFGNTVPSRNHDVVTTSTQRRNVVWKL